MLAAAGAVLFAATPASHAAKSGNIVSITLPKETAAFKQGKGVNVANAFYTVCHSADDIYMQPSLTKQQWEAEVVKMKKVYGCLIKDEDIPTVVSYLMSPDGTL